MRDELLIAQTSGSTGKCLNTYWNDEDSNNSMLPLWIARNRRYGIKSNDKACFFYTVTNQIDEFENDGVKYQTKDNLLGFYKMNLTEDKIVTIHKMMTEYQPKWLMLQPTLATLLVSFFKKNNLAPIESIAYVETTGEILMEHERTLIEEYFNCKVANQYGCNEMNSIAYECSEKRLHCMSSNVYVEILEDGKPVKDGEVGDIYLTSLNNKVMPFVRYGIGDRGRLIKEKCKCGNCNLVLELTNARKNDIVYYSDGTKGTAEVFINIVQSMNRQGDCIMAFQVVQTTREDILVKLCLNEDNMEDFDYTEDDIIEQFMEHITEERLEDMNIEFEFCDVMFLKEMNGKFKYFISEVNTSE